MNISEDCSISIANNFRNLFDNKAWYITHGSIENQPNTLEIPQSCTKMSLCKAYSIPTADALEKTVFI